MSPLFLIITKNIKKIKERLYEKLFNSRMIKDIENYLEKEIKNVGSKETKKVLKYIKQIIKDWKEVN